MHNILVRNKCSIHYTDVVPGSSSSDEYRLLEDLFNRKDGAYNSKVRPIENISDRIIIHFEMALINLINLVIQTFLYFLTNL